MIAACRIRERRRDALIADLRARLVGLPFPAFLFGSWAQGNFDAYSDIDILVVAGDRISTRTAYSLTSDRLRGIPRDYDIVVIDEGDAHEALRSGQPLNAAAEAARASAAV